MVETKVDSLSGKFDQLERAKITIPGVNAFQIMLLSFQLEMKSYN
jgi:hypothetical protein